MKRLVIFIIELYKRYVSINLKLFFGSSCRYYPTCSEYAKKSINRFGLMKGVVLSLIRILHCNPYSKKSYLDLVPEKQNV